MPLHAFQQRGKHTPPRLRGLRCRLRDHAANRSSSHCLQEDKVAEVEAAALAAPPSPAAAPPLPVLIRPQPPSSPGPDADCWEVGIEGAGAAPPAEGAAAAAAAPVSPDSIQVRPAVDV